MQGNRGGRDPFMGFGCQDLCKMQGNRGGRDPFMGFGGPFGGFSGLSGFGGQRSLVSSFFGGRDPFDDPFFTQPFGGMMGPNFFPPMPSPLIEMHPAGFVEHNPSQPKRSRGPVIEELSSDDEQEADQEGKGRKHARSSVGPHVEDPNEKDEGRLRSHLQSLDHYRNGQSRGISQPRGHSFSFQSSSVTYGGVNGSYYTSSTTRRTGSDGVTFEESKEADSATMQASHRISHGLHNKGHSMTRKLNPDGRVEKVETLHNLNQDDVGGFEEAWKGKAVKHLPGWTGHSTSYNSHGAGGNRGGGGNSGAWALPSTEHFAPMAARQISQGGGPSQPHPSRKVVNIEVPGKRLQSRGRPRGQ